MWTFGGKLRTGVHHMNKGERERRYEWHSRQSDQHPQKYKVMNKQGEF